MSILFEVTDCEFILHTTEGIYCTSKTEYRISLSEKSIKNRLGFKKSINIIYWFIKRRGLVSEEPLIKKQKVEEKKFKKKVN